MVGAPVVATGPAAGRLPGVAFAVPTPGSAEPLLTPLLGVLPGQLFARALALTKGVDAGATCHLRKVTAAA